MYDLHLLGWHSFQELCLVICRDILGQTVQSFLDTNDGGRDGAFTGVWSQGETETFEGKFVIQCKFTANRSLNLSISILHEEFLKAKRLAEADRCDVYVLMTNAGLSGSQEEKIKAEFNSMGVKHVLLLGSNWICSQIKSNTRLRMLVPRLYGLGDLSQILDERAYSQAAALLNSMKDDLSKIVITKSYHNAVSALNTYGFVLIIGEPAAGKSTIASLLAMSAIDSWEASPIKVFNSEKLIDHWNPHEPSQFFWVDDAFGVTQYEPNLVFQWNHSLRHLNSMLDRGVRIVMTSRDYIYNRARQELKESAFPLLKESQVVIDVHSLTQKEKKQMLYNHLRLGCQPKTFRTEIKPYLDIVAEQPQFIPEVARRLGDPIFTSKLNIDAHSLKAFVEKQEPILVDLLNSIDADSKAGLALLFMRKGRLVSPISLADSESIAIKRIGSTETGFRTALKALEGSLVKFNRFFTE